MKRLLPLLALAALFAFATLAGCATYPDYGYYDDGRSYQRGYDRYEDSGEYNDDRYDNGGDYYYSTRPDRSYYYDDGYYGIGPYSSGYGYGYGGYGSYGGYGGYGGSLGYGFGSRPRISLGFSSGGYGGYYPYGGYYGGYGGYYGGYSGYYGNHRSYRYNRHDSRSTRNDPWLDARERTGRRGDGVIDNDASNLAEQIARERGVRDRATPRSFSRDAVPRAQDRSSPSRGNYSRDRDAAPADDRNGWRSDYRDAQLASPRAAASGGVPSRSPASAPQLRMEQAQRGGDWRQQPQFRERAMPQTQPVQTWRGQETRTSDWSRARDAQPRMDSTPRQSYAQPHSEAPQRFSQPAPQSRSEPRGNDDAPSGNRSRERDVNEEH